MFLTYEHRNLAERKKYANNNSTTNFMAISEKSVMTLVRINVSELQHFYYKKINKHGRYQTLEVLFQTQSNSKCIKLFYFPPLVTQQVSCSNVPSLVPPRCLSHTLIRPFLLLLRHIHYEPLVILYYSTILIITNPTALTVLHHTIQIILIAII